MIDSKSLIAQGAHVPFPLHTGERVYMQPFKKADGLPFMLKRWQPTVDAMLDGVDTEGLIYIMVDQVEVQPGACSRRPGPHVDMVWLGSSHGHGGSGGHGSLACVDQGIILASDRVGCAAYLGELITSSIGSGGQYDAPTYGMDRLLLQPGIAYAGDTMNLLHESLPLAGGKRTIVRLNVNGWTPND